MVVAFLAALVTTGGVMLVTMTLSLWRRRLDPTTVHWSTSLPHLGGHEPDTHAWSRFHARYYPMTLVLVAFEMEMMFMYPWAIVYAELGAKALVEMGVFLALLSLGIVYLWREGGLAWQ